MGDPTARFDKYELYGAYHWKECDPRSRTFNPPLAARYRIASSMISAGTRAIDIGCGDGYLVSLLSRKCGSVVGIETDPRGIALAAQMLADFEHITLIRASAYQLPVATSSFDFAVMADVIEHLESPELSLRECARILHPDGTLVLTTPKWRPDRRWDVHHVREYRPQELRNQLGEFFERVDLRYFWPLKWSNLYSTRVGWRAIRVLARWLPNPFLASGVEEVRYGQILAICTGPRVERS